MLQLAFFEMCADDNIDGQAKVNGEQIPGHHGDQPDEEQPGGVEWVAHIAIEAAGDQVWGVDVLRSE